MTDKGPGPTMDRRTSSALKRIIIEMIMDKGPGPVMDMIGVSSLKECYNRDIISGPIMDRNELSLTKIL